MRLNINTDYEIPVFSNFEWTSITITQAEKSAISRNYWDGLSFKNSLGTLIENSGLVPNVSNMLYSHKNKKFDFLVTSFKNGAVHQSVDYQTILTKVLDGDWPNSYPYRLFSNKYAQNDAIDIYNHNEYFLKSWLMNFQNKGLKTELKKMHPSKLMESLINQFNQQIQNHETNQ